jgi:hypothetical protein
MPNSTISILIWSALVYAAPGLLSAQGVVSAAADPPPTYQVTGVVTDAAREPVPDAEVTLIDPSVRAWGAVTDSRGRFALGRFPAGPLLLHVRRLGYEARTIKVEVGAGGQPTSVEILLLAVPAELVSVSVTANPQGRLREFYQRRQRDTFGHFFDSDDIRRRGPPNASDLFRSVPGISIKNNPSVGGNAIRIRNCQPMVWLDGQRAPGAELDEVIQPGEIAAIEFYPSSAGTPPQYLERGNRLCGLILVWTKTQ